MMRQCMIGRCMVLMTLVTCVACGEEAAPPNKPAQQASAKPPEAAKAPVPAATPAPSTTAANPVTMPEQYTYDITLRDPFRSILVQASPASTSCGPLCEADVSRFRVIGIIWGIAQPTAMVQAPDGKPYIVKIGTPIGRNNGKIVSISQNRIAVLEKYVDHTGAVVTNQVEIELPEQGARK